MAFYSPPPSIGLTHLDNGVLLTLQDSHNWVMAFYRATGQAHKPAPPVTTGKTTTLSKNQGDADRARKHGKDACMHGKDACMVRVRAW